MDVQDSRVQLAWLEFRLTVARLVGRFHIYFAEGEDGSALFKHSTDQFSTEPAPCRLVFVERRGSP